MRSLTKMILVAAAAQLCFATTANAASCSMEGKMRSLNGNTKTTITFRAVGENDETQFKIYWLDYNGRRVFYKRLFAGDSYRQQTYLTHPWLVTAPVPGGGEDCIAIYKPRTGGRTVTLR